MTCIVVARGGGMPSAIADWNRGTAVVTKSAVGVSCCRQAGRVSKREAQNDETTRGDWLRRLSTARLG
jgi:hypothetical protein